MILIYLSLLPMFYNLKIVYYILKNMYEEQLQKEEDEFHIPPHPELQFKLDREISFKSKGLVIAFYGPASLFCQSVILENATPNARINFKKAKQKAQADIYFVQQDNVTYIIFNQQFQDMKQVHLARFINSKFQFKNCLLLVSKTQKQLLKEQSLSLRYLATSKWQQRCIGIKFDENLFGPAADLLAWGEFNRWSLVCYIGVFGQYEINRSLIQQSFGPLRGKYGLDKDRDITSKIKSYNMAKYSNKMYL